MISFQLTLQLCICILHIKKFARIDISPTNKFNRSSMYMNFWILHGSITTNSDARMKALSCGAISNKCDATISIPILLAVYTHTLLHTHSHTRTHTHSHTHTHTHTHTDIYIYIIYIYLNIYLYIHMCKYEYVYKTNVWLMSTTS